MASRTKQKEAARARRLAEERARQERERRQRRLRMIGGVVLGAVAVVAIAIAISSGGSSGGLQTGAKLAATKATVNNLLAGIPQSGNTVGSPSAKVTVTEFGDLQCPICRDFALGPENELISKDVRSGKVKLTYRSLETATGNGPNPGVFNTQQSAAGAAGLQQRAWHYILLFYHQQGTENTNYVNDAFLTGIAKQVDGLNMSKWNSDWHSPAVTGQVTADQQAAAAKSFNSTPSIVVQGPKGQAQPIVGAVSYSQLEKAINSVS